MSSIKYLILAIWDSVYEHAKSILNIWRIVDSGLSSSYDTQSSDCYIIYASQWIPTKVAKTFLREYAWIAVKSSYIICINLNGAI